MISWLWSYYNNVITCHRQKDIEIVKLTAKIKKLEGIIQSIKYIMDDN